MSCTSPLYGWYGRNKNFTMKASEAYLDQRKQVPCGKCRGCKTEKVRQWAVRMLHETKMHDISCFATLTYNDEKIPKNYSLNKRDVQLFFKKLRKKTRLRYYVCGEYGHHTMRPHYHALIFGYWPDDAEVYKDDSGRQLYTSERLASVWGNGFVTIGEANYETAQYTAKYIQKKVFGDKADDYYWGREKEFAFMSKNPGLGSKFYDKYKDEIWSSDSVVVGGKEMATPQFYKNKIRESNPELHKALKSKRLSKIYVEKDEERLAKIDKFYELKEKFFEKTKI